MKLSLVWWNTSLSPTGSSNSKTPTKRVIAQNVIEVLSKVYDADVIGLGEISTEDISSMQQKWTELGYALFNGVTLTDAGLSTFDICVLYRANKLLLLDSKNIETLKGTTTLKITQRLNLASLEDNETIFNLFLSHWPSRLWCEQNDADRYTLGDLLRAQVVASGIDSNVIILGDFNDDPFDDSLVKQLMATRDRDLAISRSHLLYNPFWRHMGIATPYAREGGGHRYGGSYYYRKGSKSKWHTFDQIIFSSAFLGKGAWHLREDMVKIVDIENYTDLVLGTEYSFDHLPVIGVLEKAT